MKPTIFMPPPPPVQQPRIPIWVVGAWPRPKSMQRVLTYDGLIPSVIGDDGQARQALPTEIREMAAFVAAGRAETTPFDVVVEGTTPGDDLDQAIATIQSWAEAGATWWLEAMWDSPSGLDGVRRRIEQGPPRPR